MASPYRVMLLFQFTKPPVCGFSERWDITANDDTEAKSRAAQIANARRKILAEDWRMVGVRLGHLGSHVVGPSPGKCKLFVRDVFLCPEIPLGLGMLGLADIPAASVFADFSYGPLSGKPARRQIRGIPDDWWNGAALTPKANTYIQQFASTLKAAVNAKVLLVLGDCSTLAFALDCVKVRRISSRRVGRPFGQLRGRRRKKRVVPA